MAEFTFSARIVITREVDVLGVPILTATVTPAESAAAQPLPPGPTGPAGPRGGPRTTFAKQGAIADASARPSGLGPADRGRWWHRLDTDGMDFWTGTAWVHSPGAVGPQGPPAPSNTIAVDTVHDPALTVAAADFTGDGAEQLLTLTAPAGVQGPPGPPGDSGAILTATDFDGTTAPTRRGMFAWSPSARKWRPTPPPNGFGPWAWYETDFAADTQEATDKLTALTVTIPPLPYRWRPLAYAQLYMYCQGDKQADVIGYVRLGSVNGVMVATGAGARSDGAYRLTTIVPTYGDEGTRSLGPSSTYATVPAYAESTLVVTAERVSTTGASTAEIGFDSARAFLTVWALPA